jgi:hypothetical protein
MALWRLMNLTAQGLYRVSKYIIRHQFHAEIIDLEHSHFGGSNPTKPNATPKTQIWNWFLGIFWFFAFWKLSNWHWFFGFRFLEYDQLALVFWVVLVSGI